MSTTILQYLAKGIAAALLLAAWIFLVYNPNPNASGILLFVQGALFTIVGHSWGSAGKPAPGETLDQVLQIAQIVKDNTNVKQIEPTVAAVVHAVESNT
jgi:hypothetical protein